MIHEFPSALVVMIGAPGSGKTGLATKWFKQTQILSLDELRGKLTDDEGDQTVEAEVVKLRADMLNIRLGRGLTTCIDSTNAHAEYRAELLAMAALHQMPAHAIVVETAARDCRRQNKARGAAGGRFVPPAAIRDIYAHMRASVGYEGPVEGFSVTRRIRFVPEFESYLYGPVDLFQGAPWLA